MIEILIICGCIVIVIYIIAKSKCSSSKCCGVEVIRDVVLEEKQHEFDVIHNVGELPKIRDIL